MSRITWMSSISGRFSIAQGSLDMAAAAMIAKAVFFPPLTVVTPSKRCPPKTRSFSICHRSVPAARRFTSPSIASIYTLLYINSIHTSGSRNKQFV